MWLIVGVISGAWAWSSKSLNSWKLLASRLNIFNFCKILKSCMKLLTNRFTISDFDKILKSCIKVLWFLDWIQKARHACLSNCCLSGSLELYQNYSHLNFPPIKAAPGTDDGGLQRGTLNSNSAEARVVLGCADPNRIIL